MEASYFLLSIDAAFLSNHGSVLIPAVEGHKHYYDYISVKSILGEAECNAEAGNISQFNSLSGFSASDKTASFHSKFKVIVDIFRRQLRKVNEKYQTLDSVAVGMCSTIYQTLQNRLLYSPCLPAFLSTKYSGGVWRQFVLVNRTLSLNSWIKFD